MNFPMITLHRPSGSLAKVAVAQIVRIDEVNRAFSGTDSRVRAIVVTSIGEFSVIETPAMIAAAIERL